VEPRRPAAEPEPAAETPPAADGAAAAPADGQPDPPVVASTTES
jgi:hypothetical protein